MWGEVESEKTLQKWKARALERAKELAERKVEESELSELSGNPLIGSLGRTGREFFNLLVDRDAHDVPLEFRDQRVTRYLHAYNGGHLRFFQLNQRSGYLIPRRMNL